jgi:hypothetical protein
MNVRIGLVCGIAALLIATSATADDSMLAAECARTFDARAREARRDYGNWLQESADARAAQKEFEKANGPKLVAFFEAHCRFLNGLETAIRKLDDPNTIVCDAPKPKGLTYRIIELSQAADVPALHIEGALDNLRCQRSDAAERFSLVFDPNGQDADNLIAIQSLSCYGSANPRCPKAMAQVAQLKAKLAAKRDALAIHP